MSRFTFYEFFAGGGMACAGLGESWHRLFANDFDQMKVKTYEANWGTEDIRHKDVATLTLSDLPARAVDLVWASFPGQDLSLAGSYHGLVGTRQGRDPVGHILVLLEADAGPDEKWACSSRDRS